MKGAVSSTSLALPWRWEQTDSPGLDFHLGRPVPLQTRAWSCVWSAPLQFEPPPRVDPSPGPVTCLRSVSDRWGWFHEHLWPPCPPTPPGVSSREQTETCASTRGESHGIVLESHGTVSKILEQISGTGWLQVFNVRSDPSVWMRAVLF